MSAILSIRTIRRLTDDDEKPSEVKHFAGYRVERLPIPPANLGRIKGKLTRALAALEVGECITLPEKGKLNVRTRERLAPKEFTERRGDGTRRIWRTK